MVCVASDSGRVGRSQTKPKQLIGFEIPQQKPTHRSRLSFHQLCPALCKELKQVTSSFFPPTVKFIMSTLTNCQLIMSTRHNNEITCFINFTRETSNFTASICQNEMCQIVRVSRWSTCPQQKTVWTCGHGNFSFNNARFRSGQAIFIVKCLW